jgi:serine phosphatase RsbU (regulator of sigma subunit)
MDIDNKEFGEDRLVKILNSERPVKNAESITKTILKEVKVFTEGAEQSDDITILSLTFH